LIHFYKRMYSRYVKCLQINIPKWPLKEVCDNVFFNGPAINTNSFRTSSGARRTLSNDATDHYIPPLMEFPHLHLPKLTYTLKNNFVSRTLITPYFDEDFSIGEFVKGAKLAACSVSEKLSSGDFTGLEDSCTEECLQRVRHRLSLFTSKQKSELNLNEDDIYYSFLYQIGIMMDDHPDQTGQYDRRVECTWVGHAFKGYFSIVEENNGNPHKIKSVLDKERGPTILNFRFIRDYSKNVEDSWRLNTINYFKLYDSYM